MTKKTIIFLITIFFSIFILEAVLRIYNPVRSTVSGNKIKLEKNMIRTIRNSILPCFDKVIFQRVNSIGFRGEDPPEDFNSYFKIITVGGSQTHSFYNTEGTTWTDYLGQKLKKNFDSKIWINNAGLDGHSTFGHIILLADYISRLKPDMVIFMVGVNDVGRLKMEDGVGEKSGISKIKVAKDEHTLWNTINNSAQYSELVSTLLNLYRLQEASKVVEGQWRVGHRLIDVTKVKKVENIDQENELTAKKYLGENYLKAYAKRLRRLIAMCREKNITPVFLSDPALFGDTVDPSTGVDLGNVITQDLFEISGRNTWKMLDGYNRVVENVCNEENVAFIDIGREMPKDSKYFYDWLHFTTAGAQIAAEIIYNDLVSFFPDHLKKKEKGLAVNESNLQNEDIRKMWELAPNNPDLCYQMGVIYESKGKLEKAITMFQKAMKSNDLYIQALTRLALIYYKQEQYNKSLAAYLKIIKNKPEIEGIYYNIACLYAKQNLVKQSMQWLNMGISRGYDNWDLIMTDKDLENLRRSEEFQVFIRNKRNHQ